MELSARMKAKPGVVKENADLKAENKVPSSRLRFIQWGIGIGLLAAGGAYTILF